MRRIVPSLASALLLMWAIPSASLAQTTFTDSQGRFAIDLPSGWAADPPGTGDVLVFKGDSRTIILEWVPGVSDPEQLMKKAMGTLRASGLANPKPAGDVLDMTINGNPARWSVLESGKLLVSFTGAVAMGNDGLYFLSIAPQSARKAVEPVAEQAFRSVRAAGASSTGASDVKAAAPAAAEGSPKPWQGESVSLLLPPGWVDRPLPRGFEKEVKGYFTHDDLPGVTMAVVVYKGFGMSSGKALDAGIKSITIPLPGLRPVETLKPKLAKNKASIVVLRGLAAGQGTEVELASVVASIDAGGKFVNLLLTGPATMQDELKRHALALAPTVD